MMWQASPFCQNVISATCGMSSQICVRASWAPVTSEEKPGGAWWTSPDSFTSTTGSQGEPALICESTGHQWWTCQFWCSRANANRAPQCLAVSTGPTTGRRALRPPSWSLFLIVWARGRPINRFGRLICADRSFNKLPESVELGSDSGRWLQFFSTAP